MAKKQSYKTQVELGKMYQDNITGIKGTAIIVSFHLHGCEQATLEYLHKVEGKPQFLTVDAARLIDVEDGAQLAPVEAKTGASTRSVASTRRTIS